MELRFQRRYRHSRKKVWSALTDREALAEWLMKNDFAAVEGRSCVFRFCVEGGTDYKAVHVTVQKLDPPRYMRWSWRGEDEAQASTVTFELEEDGDGTLLTLRHTGDVEPGLAEKLENGWPVKLDALSAVCDYE